MTYFSLVLETIQNAADGAQTKTVFELNQLMALAYRNIRNVGTNKYLNDISEIVETMLKSPTAESMLHYLMDKHVSIGVFDFGEEDIGACFVPHHNKILLPKNDLPLTKNEKARLILALAHQLRRAWQYHENLTASEDQPMTAFVKSYRNEEADAEAITALIAWELRQAQEEKPWQNWIASPKGDIPLAFSEQIDMDPQALYNGVALRSAYQYWGMDIERMKSCDERALIAYGYEVHHAGENIRMIPTHFYDNKKESSFIKEAFLYQKDSLLESNSAESQSLR